jgi:hypothetical protein
VTLVAELKAAEDSIKSLMGTVSGLWGYYLAATLDGGTMSITICDDGA